MEELSMPVWVHKCLLGSLIQMFLQAIKHKSRRINENLQLSGNDIKKFWRFFTNSFYFLNRLIEKNSCSVMKKTSSYMIEVKNPKPTNSCSIKIFIVLEGVLFYQLNFLLPDKHGAERQRFIEVTVTTWKWDLYWEYK